MKVYSFFAVTAVFLASACGYLFWLSSASDLSDEKALAITHRVKKEFLSRFHSVMSVDLGALRQARRSAELSDAHLALNQVYRYPYREISALIEYGKTCKTDWGSKLQSGLLKKAWTWQQYLCGQIRKLPQDFFETQPLMHPLGSSFAWLAISSKRPEFSSEAWIQKHSSELHLLEVLNEYVFREPEKHLSAWNLQNMLRGDELVLTGTLLFFAVPVSGMGDASSQYLAFHRADWDKFTANQPLKAGLNTDSPSCVLKEGAVCWIANSAKQAQRMRLMALVLFAAFLALLGLLVNTFIKRKQAQKQESERRLFTLQMLTHELRTPATAMKLAVEELRSGFDSLSETSQRAFLQICEELSRLGRVVEASKHYLNSHENDLSHNSARTSEPLVPVNELAAQLLEPFSDNVNLRPLPHERYVSVNRYWVELCLKNLIENALHHGKSPVEVSLAEENGALLISVKDGGSVAFASLKEMSTPFEKEAKSRGLGLGLSIVEKAARSMNGELLFSANPTTFTIKLKLNKGKAK